MAGKKVAVLEHDHSQYIIAQWHGMQPVQADVNTFGGMFNNGQVDIIGAPAMAFKPMELYKGLGTRGGIVRFPLLHVSTNIIIDRTKFPVGFGQKSREWAVSQLPKVLEWVERMEADIPEKLWIPMSAKAARMRCAVSFFCYWVICDEFLQKSKLPTLKVHKINQTIV